MNQIVKCPVCSENNVHKIFESLKYPALIFPVDLGYVDQIPMSPLIVNKCRVCSHEFQSSIDTSLLKNIYENLYRFYPFNFSSESFQGVYREPFLRAYQGMISHGDKGYLLEIGCGSVDSLKELDAPGIIAEGISPEAPSESNSRITRGFFEEATLEPKYSYMVSRFNLEHIVDLDLHLDRIRSLLLHSGKVLVQVPNIEAFRNNGIFHYFAHEHPHYFTQTSLLMLFGNKGFSIEAVNSRESPSLILLASINKFSTNVPTRKNYNLKLKEHLATIGESTIVYGASLNLAGLLYGGVIEISKVRVVDDNDNLWGRFMPGSDIVIESPHKVLSESSSANVLLLLNSAYHKDLVKKIRKWNSNLRCFIPEVTPEGLSLKEI